MQKVIAVREVWYAGRTRKPGDKFEVSDADARILCAHDLTGGQKATRVEKPVAIVKAPPAPPVELPSTPPEKDDKTESLFTQGGDTSESKPARRRYQRRDMQAED